MLRIVFTVALLTLALPALFAQTKHTDTTSPSKVTGAPTKKSDGLEYWDIKVGNGQTVKAGDNVSVHYTGWLTNGKKFDSSVDRGQPFTVENVGNAPVIKGWNEGLIGMKVGGKRQLRIPPDLAYGPGGRPPVIPPAATLIFDVEVMGIK
ncbi:MAG TPA: FKBP-type peptidyl-prolyl cis-trans isomerase [Terriglobales bacterium]|nr:FKBP-type peptidyl-prolyl cis-trans isomerase [Terriglobales bacterium]